MPQPAPATPVARTTLEFDPGRLVVGGDADIRQGLSAVVFHEGDLWLACDEGVRLERLSRAGAGLDRFAAHTVFPLHDVLDMPAGPEEESDVEGLDVDDGWLWLVGSHSVKRKKAKEGDAPTKVATKLADTSRDGNRHLLARVPLDGRALSKTSSSRRAGALAATPTSSALLEALVRHEDPHLRPFLEVPGKDNGLDIEGLAVRGTHVMVGLRGPVLREWCCVLELHVEADSTGALQLVPLDGPLPYRKRFLKLGGLGVRDLTWLGQDLLVLAGPTMAHDGPIEIWRWEDAGRAGGPERVERLLVLPHGDGGDRAEGLTILEEGGATSVLVVFDMPSEKRLTDPASVDADIYRLP